MCFCRLIVPAITSPVTLMAGVSMLIPVSALISISGTVAFILGAVTVIVSEVITVTAPLSLIWMAAFSPTMKVMLLVEPSVISPVIRRV